MRSLLSALVLLLYSTTALSESAASQQESELYASLLSWAVKLSGYPQPAAAPKVEFVPQSYFNEHACKGKRCRVWGWYPNTGEHVVYVHEAARELIADSSDPKSLLAASIIVHEFTHYLQAVKRDFAPYTCAQSIELEREAYSVQNAYIIAYGRYMQVGIAIQNSGCEGSASESTGQTDAQTQ